MVVDARQRTLQPPWLKKFEKCIANGIFPIACWSVLEHVMYIQYLMDGWMDGGESATQVVHLKWASEG